jgi:hypothetical protein
VKNADRYRIVRRGKLNREAFVAKLEKMGFSPCDHLINWDWGHVVIDLLELTWVPYTIFSLDNETMLMKAMSMKYLKIWVNENPHRFRAKQLGESFGI